MFIFTLGIFVNVGIHGMHVSMIENNRWTINVSTLPQNSVWDHGRITCTFDMANDHSPIKSVVIHFHETVNWVTVTLIPPVNLSRTFPSLDVRHDS